MNSDASRVEAEGCLFRDILEVIIPRGAGTTEPAQLTARANWLAGLRCPHLSPLSGTGKCLLRGSGNFLIVHISGLRNRSFCSDKNY